MSACCKTFRSSAHLGFYGIIIGRLGFRTRNTRSGRRCAGGADVPYESFNRFIIVTVYPVSGTDETERPLSENQAVVSELARLQLPKYFPLIFVMFPMFGCSSISALAEDKPSNRFDCPKL